MKKAFRKILRIGAIVTALLMLAVVAAVLLFLFDKPLIKNMLQAHLGKRTGMTVRASKLDYSLFPFRLTVEALELGQENDYRKLGLFLTRLEAKGDFWKLIRGTKPAIETIEAGGAVFRLEQKAVSELDFEAIILQASDALAWARRISVANARVTVSLPSLNASLENLDISFMTGDEDSGVAYSISCSDIDIKDKRGAFSLRSGLTSSGTLRLASFLGLDAAFTFDSPRVAVAGIEESFDRITIQSTGRFDIAAQEITVSLLKIGVPGLLDLEGTVGGRFGHGVFLEAEATARFDKLENVAALLGPRLPIGFRRTRLRGRAILTGKYGIQRSNQETRDSLAGSLALESVEFSHVLNGLPLQVRGSGKVYAAGPSRAPRLSVDVRSSIGKVALDNLSVGNSEVHIVAAAAKEDVDISRLDAAFKDLCFDVAEGKRISFDKATLAGRAGLNLGRKMIVLNSLEASFPGIAPLFVAGWYGLGKTPAAQVRLESRGLDIPALRTLAAPFLPESLAGWDLGGTADLSLEVRRPAASGLDWGLSGAVSLAQANLNDPSFTIASEGINPVLKVEGGYAASTGLSFRGDLEIGQGESLWKSVYVSWSKHPLRATVAGRYHPDSGRMDGLSAHFIFPTIGEVNLSGSVTARPSRSFDLRSDAHLSLGPLYSLSTQAGVSQERRMILEGKLAAGLLVLKEGDAISVTGKLTLADTNLERPLTRTLLLDVDAELPIHYESENVATDSPETPLPEEGFLRIGEFRNPIVTLKPVDVPVRVGANAFSIGPFILELYGGRLELGRTAFRADPKSGFLQGVGSLALRDLDISRLPIQSPQFKLTGKVQAEFARLDISPKKIAVSGRGEADVFGGKVVLRDLAVSNPFTPGRSIALNIDLLDLDLKKLTQEVPFGEVTGIVRGEVRNLVISYGQPEQFEFRIESVPRKGVPQTFSLKAVDNLTVLSSGEQATAGTNRFWMRYIRGFRYQKLGIVSTLRNDTFTLNGTIHERGVEYLVKKSALSGINVVNRMPQNVISFKEMTSRLKRVGQSEK